MSFRWESSGTCPALALSAVLRLPRTAQRTSGFRTLMAATLGTVETRIGFAEEDMSRAPAPDSY